MSWRIVIVCLLVGVLMGVSGSAPGPSRRAEAMDYDEITRRQRGEAPEQLRNDLDEARRQIRELEGAVRNQPPQPQPSSGSDDSGRALAEVRKLQERVERLERDNLRLMLMLAEKAAPAAARPPAGVKSPPGTPARLHEDVLEKAAELGLAQRLPAGNDRDMALLSLRRWAEESGIFGRGIDWPVMLIQACDIGTEEIAEAQARVKQAQRNLLAAMDRMTTIEARKTTAKYSSAQKQKDLKAQQEFVAKGQQALDHADAELAEAKAYRLGVVVSPPGRPDILIEARVSDAERAFVAGLPPFGTFTLRGAVAGVRCDRDALDKAVLVIELRRCRAVRN